MNLNRQLTKLLSGERGTGKVAIAAMQMIVNFTRSLSRWPRKVFEHSFLLIREGSNARRSVSRASASSRRIFYGKKGRSIWQETTVHDPQLREAVIESPVLFCCAVVHRSFNFFFLIFQRNSSTVKPALNDHRFKRPPAFSDRFFMDGESAIQTALC